MVLIYEVWIGAGPSNYPGLALHLSPGTIDTFRGLPDARPGQRAAGDEKTVSRRGRKESVGSQRKPNRRVFGRFARPMRHNLALHSAICAKSFEITAAQSRERRRENAGL